MSLFGDVFHITTTNIIKYLEMKSPQYLGDVELAHLPTLVFHWWFPMANPSPEGPRPASAPRSPRPARSPLRPSGWASCSAPDKCSSWMILGWFLDDFWMIFGWLLMTLDDFWDFWKILEYVWMLFGWFWMFLEEMIFGFSFVIFGWLLDDFWMIFARFWKLFWRFRMFLDVFWMIVDDVWWVLMILDDLEISIYFAGEQDWKYIPLTSEAKVCRRRWLLAMFCHHDLLNPSLFISNERSLYDVGTPNHPDHWNLRSLLGSCALANPSAVDHVGLGALCAATLPSLRRNHAFYQVLVLSGWNCPDLGQKRFPVGGHLAPWQCRGAS